MSASVSSLVGVGKVSSEVVKLHWEGEVGGLLDPDGTVDAELGVGGSHCLFNLLLMVLQQLGYCSPRKNVLTCASSY